MQLRHKLVSYGWKNIQLRHLLLYVQANKFCHPLLAHSSKQKIRSQIEEERHSINEGGAQINKANSTLRITVAAAAGAVMMAMEEEEEPREPVSPTGQYFTSSAISVSVIAVLESEVPIQDSQTMPLLKNLFLPINPRFSSVMVEDKNGIKHWKKVDVELEDHVNYPTFPQGKSPEFYDDCLKEYLSKIAMEQFRESRPLWELHLIEYPTKTAAGSIVFKLHHSLGDGFSLMGALLSCLQRADDPSKPLTFPSLNRMTEKTGRKCIGRSLVRAAVAAVNTVTDFGWTLLKIFALEDDRTPIRSGKAGVEFRPITITSLAFSLDQIKQIKANLHVSVNDVVSGVVFLGIRLYIQSTNQDQKRSKSTALVLLNTRNIGGYKSIAEMLDQESASQWGNQFAFLHVPVPKSDPNEPDNPLHFVMKSSKVVRKKRNSAAVILTGRLLDNLRKFRGPERTAKYIHSTLKNTSLTISNLVGPLEPMALSNHPIRGFYFMVVGVPQNLTVTVVSYMGQLRMAVGTENGLIDATKFKSCLQNAFDAIFKAAVLSDA